MNIAGCKIITKGRHASRNIALTFDDGPHYDYTRTILKILETRGAQGTFFSTGNNICKNKQLAVELVKRGHVLANHTFNHINPLFTKKNRLFDEILRTKEIIEDITGEQSLYFRPPYGMVTPSVVSVCKKLGLSIVLWNSNTYDFRREPSEIIIKRIKRKIKPDAIILFHECHFNNESIDYSNTIRSLETVLDIAILKEIKPVTIREMV